MVAQAPIRPPLPRLVFSGRFYTDPSTVNNDINHYDVANFRPNYQLLEDDYDRNGWWNPEGTGSFALVDCSVNAVHTVQPPAVVSATTVNKLHKPIDPLINTKLINNPYTVNGKIVDLDPQMQMVSEIYGLTVNLRGENDESCLIAVMEKTAFRDFWQYNDCLSGDANRSAVYQSVLKVQRFRPGSSLFLQESAPYIEQSKLATDPNGTPYFECGALSIRIRVDRYETDVKSQNYRYGNVTGIIQPWLPEYPYRFDAGRKLSPMSNPRDIPSGPAYGHLQIQGEESPKYSFYLDLSNSLQRKTPTEYENIGYLFLVVVDGTAGEGSSQFIKLTEINYLDPRWEHDTSGVVEFDVAEEHIPIIQNNPLALVAFADKKFTIILKEAEDGIFCRADLYVHRINPILSANPHSLDIVQSDVYATKFGTRIDGTLLVGFDSSAMATDGSGPGGPQPGVPVNILTINDKNPTDPNPDTFVTKVPLANGIASVRIHGGDCSNPRGFIDGQVYGLRYSAVEAPPECLSDESLLEKLPPISADVSNSEKINIHLYDVYNIPEKPSWLSHVLPIFKLYANLYPSMDRVVRLDDYGSVLGRRKVLIEAFCAEEDNPRYMPVTRDLSRNKREMIVKWLKSDNADPLYMDINSKVDLYAALQTAIELEHATLPPYLTAMFSIKQGYNQNVYDALRDVVDEEMAHFALACNILIAIGGSPEINKIGFVPKYPGPLPGGLRRGLIVRLRKLSISQLRMFMDIETPEEQALAENGDVNNSVPVQKNRYTIGYLYGLIKDSITALSETDDEGNKISFPTEGERFDYQVTGHFNITKITSRDEAIGAITLITDEGEGTGVTSPTDCVIDPITGLPELSHYFRFAEIVKGRRIILDKDENGIARGFSYSGPPIILDEDGVYNMRDDPNIKDLPKGSRARDRMEAFARMYQAMLNGLHVAFNGHPERLEEAVGMMFQLTMTAKSLMELEGINEDGTPKKDGTTVGVSFQVPFSD